MKCVRMRTYLALFAAFTDRDGLVWIGDAKDFDRQVEDITINRG